MTEETFTELGFVKETISVVESGYHKPFYYYTMDIGDVTLITNDDEDAEENGWFATIFDSVTLRIRGAGDLEELIKILKLNT